MGNWTHFGNAVVVDTDGKSGNGTTSGSVSNEERLSSSLETFADSVSTWMVGFVGGAWWYGGASDAWLRRVLCRGAWRGWVTGLRRGLDVGHDL